MYIPLTVMMSRLGINNVHGLILVCGSFELPLSVNGDRISINGDRKLKSDNFDLGKYNGAGSDLPRAVMVADHASKAVSFLAVVHS